MTSQQPLEKQALMAVVLEQILVETRLWGRLKSEFFVWILRAATETTFVAIPQTMLISTFAKGM